jgi:pimeloyl-ACP methyl ester carboxylesterase
MKDSASAVIFLSGAGGGAPDFDVFRRDAEDLTRFALVSYPGWKSYILPGFSAEILVTDLAARIAAIVPQGPIRVIGLSIGGHLGYAVALRLEAMGREIAGFCAIDSFMVASSGPSSGWKGRALAQALDLLSSRRFGEFAGFLRSRVWRALIRLAGANLPVLLQRLSFLNPLPSILAFDPILEQELSMRLLIRTAAPWLASIDCEPVALEAPASLLRTTSTAGDDAVWRRRCPKIEIFEQLRDVFLVATRNW